MPWLRSLSGRLDGLPLERAVVLLPARGFTPDFLTPPPSGPLGSIEDDFAALRATRAAQIRDEMELFASQHPKANETVERWVAHPRREVRRLADVLEAYRMDLGRARRLIAASGTKGMRVRVINDVRTRDQAFIVRLLRTLGYRASAWIVPGRDYGLTISDSRAGVQIGNGGWNADYPAASNLFDSKFSCGAYRPANPFNNNDSEFCDRRIEAGAERARRLGITNPDASTRAWTKVYRDILDRAPWLPTVTPTWTDFVSRRVGNYQFHPLWGILVDQLWVR